jgi:hypothetical protein
MKMTKKPLDNMPLPTNLTAGKDRGLTNTAKKSAPLGGMVLNVPVLPTGGNKPNGLKRMVLAGSTKAPSVPPRFGGA